MSVYFAVYDVWHAAVEDESIVLRAVCGEPIPREGPGPVTKARPARLCRGCGGRAAGRPVENLVYGVRVG